MPNTTKHPQPFRTPRRRLASSSVTLYALSSLGASFAACSDAPLSVGSNDVALQHGACGNGVVTGSMLVRQQADADALLDCTEIQGNLIIKGPADVSLAALGSLRVVHGDLSIENLASLAGLEALEQVSNLTLLNLAAADLKPLASMQRVAWDPDSERLGGGGINIAGCDNLKDLTGLDQLRTWTDLAVSSNAALESLSGLQAPRLVNSVQIDSPLLSDIDALQGIQQMQAFVLAATAIERFRRFSLNWVKSLSVLQNPALVDLLGLPQLSTVGDLVIRSNDSLVDVRLPLLRSCDSISITDNAVLETVPAYTTGGKLSVGIPELAYDGDPQSEPPVPPSFDWPRFYEVGNNARLTAVAAPSGYTDVQMVAIWGNPSLARLDLRSLAQADALIIRDNAALDQLQIDQLDHVDTLQVVNNPALTTSAFSGVQSFSSTISGNLDAPASSNPPLP